jgi:membrane protease YdiL (CAAX protease family)
LSDDFGARTGRRTTTSLALACVVVWLVASASAGALGIWLALGGASVALGVSVFVLDRAAALRLIRPSARLVLVGAAAGLSMAAATYLLYPVLARVLPFIRTDMASLYASFRELPRVIAALALVPVILGEEVVWRGVVQTTCVRRLGPWRGVPVAALVYALAHAPLGSPVLVVVALSCGMAWGALRAASASLVPSLLAHLVWDILVLLWLPLDDYPTGCGL